MNFMLADWPFHITIALGVGHNWTPWHTRQSYMTMSNNSTVIHFIVTYFNNSLHANTCTSDEGMVPY